MTLKSDYESPFDCSNGEEGSNPSWQFDGSSNSNGAEDSWQMANSPPSRDGGEESGGGQDAGRGWGLTGASTPVTEGNSVGPSSLVPEPVNVGALAGKNTDTNKPAKAKSGTASKQRGVFEKRKRPSKEEEKKKPSKPKE